MWFSVSNIQNLGYVGCIMINTFPGTDQIEKLRILLVLDVRIPAETRSVDAPLKSLNVTFQSFSLYENPRWNIR